MAIELSEQLGVRDRCNYFVADEEPPYGRWWAVQLVDVTPPGEMFPTTPDGYAVENKAVIAAEKREDGTWMWLGLTAAARLVFGNLLEGQHTPSGTWVYIVEVDMKILELADTFTDEEMEELL